MAESRCVYLMYHELEVPGRRVCQSAPGYLRYVLTASHFRQQMQWLKEAGYQGKSVGEALGNCSEKTVCLTFDDGCETDLIAAAPVLNEYGFKATFYLTAGFVGTQGYLSPEQVRELDANGFEIGCHSMTHPYLSDLADAEMKREILDAKIRTEQIVGHAIEHFSLPGGRYDTRTLDMARSAGFRTVATSLFHTNSAQTSPYKLGRIAIYRDTDAHEFAEICEGRGLWKKQLRDSTRHLLQRVLGNRAYDQVRAVLLREPKS